MAFHRTGNAERAIADWTRTLELDPDHAKAYDLLGQSYQDRGQYDQSISYLTKLIALKPNYAEAYYNRGRAYYGKGNLESALRDAQKSCKLGYQPACQIYERYKNRVR